MLSKTKARRGAGSLPGGYTYQSISKADWFNSAINVVKEPWIVLNEADCASQTIAKGANFYAYNDVNKNCMPKQAPPYSGFNSLVLTGSKTSYFVLPDLDFQNLFDMGPNLNRPVASEAQCALFCAQSPGCVIGSFGRNFNTCVLKQPVDFTNIEPQLNAGVVYPPTLLTVPDPCISTTICSAAQCGTVIVDNCGSPKTCAACPLITKTTENTNVITKNPPVVPTEKPTEKLTAETTVVLMTVTNSKGVPEVQTVVETVAPPIAAPETKSNGSNTGLIVGIGGVLTFLLFGCFLWFYKRRQGQKVTSEAKNAGSNAHSATPTTSTESNQLEASALAATIEIDANAEIGRQMKHSAARNLAAVDTATITSIPMISPTLTEQSETANLLSSNSGVSPINPQEWTVAQVAAWIHNNGGHEDRVREFQINGKLLMSLSVEDLIRILRIETLGDQVVFSDAIAGLHAPPSYNVE
ncbi:hypothetical protein BDR26DRAFT_1012818 [Obelidium mucronatum]|nr:hypothetical protein BDR26DRAFT_1012818 [Obelidium mucronatum]